MIGGEGFGLWIFGNYRSFFNAMELLVENILLRYCIFLYADYIAI